MMPWIDATTENSIVANWGPPSEERSGVVRIRPRDRGGL